MQFNNLFHLISNKINNRIILLAVIIFFASSVNAANEPDTTVASNTRVPFIFSIDTLADLVSDADELRAGMLYDADRGKIVWQKNIETAFPIASLTKMMVGLLAIEDVEAGLVNLTDEVVVSRTFKKKVKRRKYKTYTSEEKFTLEGILKLAMVASNNESTVWIAKHCSEDLSLFVQRMNQRAIELGMTKTFYNNPSGLPAGGGLSDNCASVQDLLLLSLEILKHPQLMAITQIDYAKVSNGKGAYSIHNHNGLVINYNNEVDGIKTGYTKAARFCLVATSHRGDHRLVSIALGVRSPWVRNGIVAGMMNEYYDAIKLGRLGETNIDLSASQLFLDSVNLGLAIIKPNVAPRHMDKSDESFAYTYKIVKTKTKTIHVVRSGENLSKIADKYDVAMVDLKQWNNIHSSKVLKGQKLVVFKNVNKRVPVKLIVDPDEDCTENCTDGLDSITPAVSNLDEIKKDCKTNKTVVQKVENSSDTIGLKNNKISDTNKLIYYTVQPGDTLWNIAQRYQTNVAEIRKVNRISNGKYLKAGTRIKVPVNT